MEGKKIRQFDAQFLRIPAWYHAGMAKARFTLAEAMVILTTTAVTLGVGRALGLPLFAQAACAIVGLWGFALIVWTRR